MSCSPLLRVVLMVLFFRLIVSNNLKELCENFRPGLLNHFDGIRVYQKYDNISGKLKALMMYSFKKEWRFVVTQGRVVFLDETFKDNGNNESDLTFIKFTINQTIGDSNRFRYQVIECVITRSTKRKDGAKRIYCDDNNQGRLNLKSTIDKIFESAIVFTPNYRLDRKETIIGLLDTKNTSNIKFYDPIKDSLMSSRDCRDCIPKELSDIPNNLISQLDGIIELRDDFSGLQNGLILFLRKDSKPFICIVKSNQKIKDECIDDNLREYGYECNYLSKDFLTNPIFIGSLAIIAFIAYDLGFISGFIAVRCSRDKKQKTKDKKPKHETQYISIDKLSPRVKKELGLEPEEPLDATKTIDDSKSDTKSKPKTETNLKIDSKHEIESKSKIESKLKIDSKPKTESKLKIDSKPKTESKLKIDSKPKTESKLNIESKSKTDSKLKVDSKSVIELKPNSQTIKSSEQSAKSGEKSTIQSTFSSNPK